MRYLEFAQFQAGQERPERLMLLLDVSGSMEADDWKPTRLGGAIEAGIALLDVKAARYPEDEVGIVSFSSGARTVHPPVGMAKGLGRLKPALQGLKSESSTNITAGLKKAGTHLLGAKEAKRRKIATGGLLERLSQLVYGVPPSSSARSKNAGKLLRIVALTDGQHNHGGSPRRAATALKNAGVVIDCVGIGGSPEGG